MALIQSWKNSYRIMFCFFFFVSVSDANVVRATRHTMAMHLECYINLTVERDSFAAV